MLGQQEAEVRSSRIILFRFDRLSFAYIFGRTYYMSFFLPVVPESENPLSLTEPDIASRIFSGQRNNDAYIISSIFRHENLAQPQNFDISSAHSQDRVSAEPNITFRGFLTSIRDPRVQEILVITEPNVMSRTSFLSKANAGLNTGFPTVKYESHTPSQELVKSGALQGI